MQMQVVMHSSLQVNRLAAGPVLQWAAAAERQGRPQVGPRLLHLPGQPAGVASTVRRSTSSCQEGHHLLHKLVHCERSAVQGVNLDLIAYQGTLKHRHKVAQQGQLDDALAGAAAALCALQADAHLPRGSNCPADHQHIPVLSVPFYSIAGAAATVRALGADVHLPRGH